MGLSAVPLTIAQPASAETATSATVTALLSTSAMQAQEPCREVGLTFKGGKNHPSDYFSGKRCSRQGAGGYCRDYNNNYPTGRGDVVDGMSDLSEVQEQQLFYLLNKHGATNDRVKAALVNFAVNTIIGDKDFLEDYNSSYAPQLGSDRVKAVIALVKEAERNAGPSSLIVTLTPPAANTGNVGEAKIEVRSARGNLVSYPVGLRWVGATGPSSMVTSASSVVIAKYRPTAGQVRLEATSNVVNSTTGLVTRTNSPNDQRLVYTSTPFTVLKATAGYSSSFSWTCPSNCAGDASSTLKACVTGEGYKARYIVKKNNRVLEQFDVPKGCVTRVYQVRDNDTLAVNYASTTGTRPLPPSREIARIQIVCPPLPAPRIEAGCDCDNPGKVKGAFKADNITTIRYLNVVARIDGQVVLNEWVVPGQKFVSREFSWNSGLSVSVKAQYHDSNPANGTTKAIGTPGELTAVVTSSGKQALRAA